MVNQQHFNFVELLVNKMVLQKVQFHRMGLQSTLWMPPWKMCPKWSPSIWSSRNKTTLITSHCYS